MASHESAKIRETIVRDRVPEGVSIQQERREWEEYAATLQLAPGIVQREETIGGVPCLWLADESEQYQGSILYVHGGGLIAGSPRTHREFASRLAMRLGRRVLLADYRLAPEHPFPAALEDVEAVYLELLASTLAYDYAKLDQSLVRDVLFSDHSLATDHVFAEVQLVSCRNVLIYFDRELKDRALGLFHDALTHKGFLGLGAKETLRLTAHAHAFREFARNQRIYQKR